MHYIKIILAHFKRRVCSQAVNDQAVHWSVKQPAVKPAWLVILFVSASESVGQTVKGKGRKKNKLVLQVVNEAVSQPVR